MADIDCRDRWKLPPQRLGFVLAAIAVSGLLLTTGTSGAGRRPAFAQAARPKAPSKTVAEPLYKKHCYLCHLEGDSPIEPLNFVNGKWAHGSRTEDIVTIIRDGAPGTAMTGFKELLTPQEIRALAEYVRAFDKSLKPEKR